MRQMPRKNAKHSRSIEPPRPTFTHPQISKSWPNVGGDPILSDPPNPVHPPPERRHPLLLRPRRPRPPPSPISPRCNLGSGFRSLDRPPSPLRQVPPSSRSPPRGPLHPLHLLRPRQEAGRRRALGLIQFHRRLQEIAGISSIGWIGKWARIFWPDLQIDFAQIQSIKHKTLSLSILSQCQLGDCIEKYIYLWKFAVLLYFLQCLIVD